jgi:outer membrane protein TolC
MRTVLAALFLTAGALYSETLTLDQCLDLALKKSPDIITLQNDYESGRAKTREVRSVFLPRVSAAFSANRQVSPLSSTFGDMAPLFPGLGREIDNTNYSLGLSASQNIWDFGRSLAAERQISLSEELAALQLEKKKIEVVYNVKKGYYALLQAKNMEKVSALTLADLKHLLEAVRARKDQGLATPVDVLNAEVETLKFDHEAKKAANQAELAVIALKNLLVKNEEEVLTLAEEKLAAPAGEPLGLKNYEEAKMKTLACRLDFKELKLRGKIAAESVGGAYADYWPSLAGQAGYQYTGNDLYLKNASWSIGLNISLPLFDGFSRAAKVEQAELAVKNVAVSGKLLEQTLLLQVKNNYFKIKEAKNACELALVKLEYLKKNLEAVTAKYEQGLSTVTDLIEAQTKKSSAELENLQAVYAFYTGLNDLEYSIGGSK